MVQHQRTQSDTFCLQKMTSPETWKALELTINEKDYVATYSLNTDRLTFRLWNGQPNFPITKLPKLFEAVGFEDFCEDLGLFDINKMVYSDELQTWVEEDQKLVMYDFIQEEKWLEDAILQFIEQPEYAKYFQ